MKRIKKNGFLLAISLGTLTLCSCSFGTPPFSNTSDSDSLTSSIEVSIGSGIPSVTTSEEVSDFSSASSIVESGSVNESSYDSSITLLDGGSSTNSPDKVSISGDIITISSLGTYLINGTLSNGSIIITAEAISDDDDTVELILNGVSISSSGTGLSPIFSKNSAHLKISKAEESANLIFDHRNATSDSDDKAAIFSNKKLKIVGAGSLRVESTFNNGIASDTHIEASGGSLFVSAPNKGIKAHDSIRLGGSEKQGSFEIISTGADGDAIRVDEVDADITAPDIDNDSFAGICLKSGAYEITAAGKGINSESNLYIISGKGKITSSADKGIKAELDLCLAGGEFTVTSLLNDCIHSSLGSVYATGGDFTLSTGKTNLRDSSGNSYNPQGISAEINLVISGGNINVLSSCEGFAARHIYATGGTTSVSSGDDGWNAGGSSTTSDPCLISISGGEHYVYASGDGLDSNGNIVVSGGITVVAAPSSSGNGPIDFAEGGMDGFSGSFKQSGGILVGYGVSGMSVNSSGTQNSILVSSHSTLSASSTYGFLAGTNKYIVHLKRTSSTIYASFAEYSNNSYGIYSLSSYTGEEVVSSVCGLSKVEDFSISTTLVSGTFSSTTNTHIGSNSSGGGGGGGGGGGRPW